MGSEIPLVCIGVFVKLPLSLGCYLREPSPSWLAVASLIKVCIANWAIISRSACYVSKPDRRRGYKAISYFDTIIAQLAAIFEGERTIGQAPCLPSVQPHSKAIGARSNT